MVLDGAGDDFRRAGGVAVNENHQGEIAPVVAARGVVAPFPLGAAPVADDQLIFFQKHIRHRHAFVQQAAGIAAQV